MKIAILGWGSLIWDPRNLEIDKSQGKNGWFDDGPMLPIEFARISKDGRLTLVIVPGNKEVQTLYAISKFNVLDQSILNLAVREGCVQTKIGLFVKANFKFQSRSIEIQLNIERWISEHQEIDAVIWTDLTENFLEITRIPLTEENAVNYLNDLPLGIKVKAEQYIRRAPSTIDTSIRKSVEKLLHWFQSDI